MIRFLLRLALVALVANATWHVFLAYSAHYKFRDAVESASQFGDALSEEQLRQKVLDLAAQFDVPVAPESVTIRRENKHTYIDASYTRPVELAPSVPYVWPFTLHTDTLSFRGEAGDPGALAPLPVVPR